MNRATYDMMLDALRKLNFQLYFSDDDDGIREFATQIGVEFEPLREAIHAGRDALAAARSLL